MKVIDLFCGAGGFSLGFKQAGFDIILGIDLWERALETHKLNIGGDVLNADVRDLEIKDLPACDVLIGSPPCPDFSIQTQTGGKRKKECTALSKSQKDIAAGFHPSITKGWTSCNCKAGFEPGIVLDPFAGAGTALLVAKEMRRRFIGIDIKQEYCDMCEKRLAQGVL